MEGRTDDLYRGGSGDTDKEVKEVTGQAVSTGPNANVATEERL